MSDQFNWQFDKDRDDLFSHAARNSRRGSPFWFWLFALLALISIVASWAIYKQRAEKETVNLIEEIQDVLDLQHQALSAGDGDLFFSLHAGDPQWFSAHLLPQNQVINRAGLSATNAEEHGENIWVNATWEDEGKVRQRILFFESRAGHMRQVPTDPTYWGNLLLNEYEWGTLKYHAVDDLWADSIANSIANDIEEVCQVSCLEDRLPLTIVIRDDYQETAEPGYIHIPSPRLQGLDLDGRPSSLFWQNLDRRISSTLSPATIRIAVPPVQLRGAHQWLVNYSELANHFMAAHPDISLELVELEALPEDLSTLASEFDGVAITPTEAMLALGLVRNLDDYIESDPEFDQADFYDQIWQGAVWQERTWFMPQAAEMSILYYDRQAYDNADYPDPSSRWTWEEMAQDISTIVGDQPQESDLAWGFLDVGLDTLYSYAYNWNNQCTEEAAVLCQAPLSEQNVAAAFDWYSGMANQPGQMPDLVHRLSDSFSPTQMASLETTLRDDPRMLMLNFQGSQRKAAIWVDAPLSYEFNLLLAPVGVVSFPGSDRFDGISPLWLQGGFISQNSDHPLAVWEWLKFLSYQSPTARFIPARPSVAAESGYWTYLPRPLGDVMRTAFPFARPVAIGEQNMITWEQVTAVVSGASSAAEAAQDQPALHWFGYDQE